jgi:hypothetical protein
MLNLFEDFKRIFKDENQGTQTVPFDTTAVSIRQMKNGRYRLLENGNEVIGTYARYRDAVRGARRRGLEIT